MSLWLRSLSLRWDGKRSHKSFCSEFFNIVTDGLIIESDLFGNIEDRVLTFEAHHDLFNGAVERPVLAPIDPETITAEKNRTAEIALRDVVAGIHADDLFGRLSG